MTVLTIIIAILILIAFLRVGVSAVYCGDGFFLSARVGFVSLRILPAKEQKKPETKQKKKLPKEKKKKQPEQQKPGKLGGFLDLIPAAKKALGRLRRKLLIKRLKIYYTAAGDDPVKTALSFGAASAVFGNITAILENSFKIRRRDFRSAADFNAAEPYIYLDAAISLAVWEAVYISLAMLSPLFKTVKGKHRKG